MAYCWDDHDFLGDNSQGGTPENAGARTVARDAYAEGGRAGFPVFQAGALESSGSEKGGPYSIGDESGGRDWIGDRRQFGLCEVVYGN